jgi:hypothetical protein
MDINQAQAMAKAAGLTLKRARGSARKDPDYLLGAEGATVKYTLFPGPFSAVDPESYRLEIGRYLNRAGLNPL